MKLPLKISPDNIKNSIVELRYTSKLPFEILLGYIFQALDQSYNYVNRPVPVRSNQIEVNFEISLPVQYVFYTDYIKIELRPNSLIFNCLDNYLGWKVYMTEIEKTVRQMSQSKVIETFTRIGIRYISDYPEMDIKYCTKFDFKFGIPQIQSETYHFRTEFLWDNYKIILNLQNRTPSISSNQVDVAVELKKTSVIDIDVIIDNLNIVEPDTLLSQIEKAHQKEKEIFFTLLKDEYLEIINPVYE